MERTIKLEAGQLTVEPRKDGDGYCYYRMNFVPVDDEFKPAPFNMGEERDTIHKPTTQEADKLLQEITDRIEKQFQGFREKKDKDAKWSNQ